MITSQDDEKLRSLEEILGEIAALDEKLEELEKLIIDL